MLCVGTIILEERRERRKEMGDRGREDVVEGERKEEGKEAD